MSAWVCFLGSKYQSSIAALQGSTQGLGFKAHLLLQSQMSRGLNTPEAVRGQKSVGGQNREGREKYWWVVVKEGVIGEIWEDRKTHKLVLKRENTQRDVKEQAAGGKRVGGWGGVKARRGSWGSTKCRRPTVSWR